MVTQQLDVLAKTADIAFVKKADAAAERGDISKIGLYQYASLGIIVLFKVVPIFLAVLVGGEYVQSLFDMIPDVVMKGLNVAGGLLPAIGFGMLLNMMLKKKMWVFLLVALSPPPSWACPRSASPLWRRRGLPDRHDGQRLRFRDPRPRCRPDRIRFQ